jgi:hypothetical protein
VDGVACRYGDAALIDSSLFDPVQISSGFR